MIQILNKKLSFKNDLGITIFNGFIVIIGIFLLNGYIARVLGIEYLGEYLLLRTVVLSIIGVLLIGMNISLPTFIAKGKDHTSEATLIIFLCIWDILASEIPR